MKTVSLKLTAGLLLLGPLLACTIRDHREAIGAARRGELEPIDMMDLTCQLATACAQRVDPTATQESVEQLVDMENFSTVWAACWGVSLPEPAPGEAQAAGPAEEPSPST